MRPSTDALKRLNYLGMFKNKVIIYAIMLFIKKVYAVNEDKNVVMM